jgi:hypothetical protein
MATATEGEHKQLIADLEFQQKALKERWDNAKQKLEELRTSVKWRTFFAIVFRGVFILGGFAVSLGSPWLLAADRRWNSYVGWTD